MAAGADGEVYCTYPVHTDGGPRLTVPPPLSSAADQGLPEAADGGDAAELEEEAAGEEVAQAARRPAQP